MDTLQCPACGSINPGQAMVCQDCNEDLSTIKNVLDTAKQHYNESLALAQSNRLDEAIGQVEAALAITSHDPNYHLLLGTLNAQKENWDGAIVAWERCLSINPDTEKAFHNIEKAQEMIEEEAYEQSKRPFILGAIGAGVAAIIFLLSTGFFAAQYYFKSNENTQLATILQTKAKESNDWRQKFTTLSENFPKEGLQGLLAQVSQWKTLAEQRQKTIEQAEARYKTSVDQRNQEIQKRQKKIQQLESQIANQRKSITQINPLRHSLVVKSKDIEKKDAIMSSQNAILLENKNKISLLTQQVAAALQKVDSSKMNHQTALVKTKSNAGKEIEKLRKEIQTLLDEIAAKDRELTDLEYADNLLVQAIQKFEDNKFSESSSLIQNALDRRKEHAPSLYLQKNIQKILTNPVEEEIHRQIAASRPAMRVKIRSELASRRINQAKNYLGNGEFDNAIKTAQNTLAFIPANSSEAKQCNQLIQKAEKDEADITRQLSEARSYIDDKNFRKAKTLLKDIIKRSPSFTEASVLLGQINQ